MSANVRSGARPGGRHLLRSSALAEEIVRDAGVAPGELVVDVGAGTGMLTRALVVGGARVIAIEPDRRFAARLRRACPEATVVEADALATPWPREPFRVVANLPFDRTTEICRSLLSDPAVPLESAELVVQWDLALKRARVWPSTVLGVTWAAWYELSVVRRLPPESFAPPPSVAAGVLRARRRALPLVAAADRARYEGFVRRAFRSGHVSGQAGVRPRELDPHQWARLFQQREPSASTRTVGAMTRRGRAR